MDVGRILHDSGAAAHVCPNDYASLGASTPHLFTATDDPIKVWGNRRVQYKCQGVKDNQMSSPMLHVM